MPQGGNLRPRVFCTPHSILSSAFGSRINDKSPQRDYLSLVSHEPHSSIHRPKSRITKDKENKFLEETVSLCTYSVMTYWAPPLYRVCFRQRDTEHSTPRNLREPPISSAPAELYSIVSSSVGPSWPIQSSMHHCLSESLLALFFALKNAISDVFLIFCL